MAVPVLLGLLCVSLPACGAAAPRWPARLSTTVHRFEEQGIDYSSVGTSRFELTLDASGAGEAVRSSRGTDVMGEDAHQTDETVRYTARARWVGDRLHIALEPAAGSPVIAEPLELDCERWSADAQADSSQVTDAALPGVEWICMLPRDHLFGLGLVVVQHVPREGGFLLLGESQSVTVRERIDGSGREVTTNAGE